MTKWCRKYVFRVGNQYTIVTNCSPLSFDLLRPGSQISAIQIKNIQGLLGPSGQINKHVFMSVQ